MNSAAARSAWSPTSQHTEAERAASEHLPVPEGGGRAKQRGIQNIINNYYYHYYFLPVFLLDNHFAAVYRKLPYCGTSKRLPFNELSGRTNL